MSHIICHSHKDTFESERGGTKMIKNHQLTYVKCKLEQYHIISDIWFPYSLGKPDIRQASLYPDLVRNI